MDFEEQENEEDNGDEHELERPVCAVNVRIVNGYNAQNLFRSHKRVVLMFHSLGCDHCEATLPAFRQASMHLCNRARLLTVDVDANPEIADAHDIQALPTIVLLHDGQFLRRIEGASSTAEIVNFITRDL